MSKKLLIGGKALNELGSSRSTLDTDYLICDKTTSDAFIKDEENNTDYINASGNDFFAEVWAMEASNIGPIASPKALVELKAFALVQHCKNGFWQKADDAEYDIKFLVRSFGVSPSIVKKYVGAGEWQEIVKIVKSTRK